MPAPPPVACNAHAHTQTGPARHLLLLAAYELTAFPLPHTPVQLISFFTLPPLPHLVPLFFPLLLFFLLLPLPYELDPFSPEKLRVRKAQIHRQHPDPRRRLLQQYPSSRPNTSERRPRSPHLVHFDHIASNEPSRGQPPAQLYSQLPSRPSRTWRSASWPHQSSDQPRSRSQPHPSVADGRRSFSHQHRCSCRIPAQHGSWHGRRPSDGPSRRSSPGLSSPSWLPSWPSPAFRSHGAATIWPEPRRGGGF